MLFMVILSESTLKDELFKSLWPLRSFFFRQMSMIAKIALSVYPAAFKCFVGRNILWFLVLFSEIEYLLCISSLCTSSLKN